MMERVKHGFKKITAMLLAACMLICILSSTAAAAEDEISVRADAPVQASVVQGGIYDIQLNALFANTSGADFSWDCDQKDKCAEHTKIKDGGFHFSSSEAGEYKVTITASRNLKTVEHQMTITVTEAPQGLPVQYNYDETPASEVTVYVTVSCDGVPILGNDENRTPLSHLEVTVPYFDLEAFGLQDFYRYHTENGSGGYNSDQVVQRPTALHLYLYLLQRYALGYEEVKCGNERYAEAYNPIEGTIKEVVNMYGDPAYGERQYMAPLNITGSSTSLYMQQFWGHDENLMYYRNHVYPLMSPGWGSTCDYILLSDGDTIDLAMFTNWDFYQYGHFNCLGQNGQPVDTFRMTTDETLEFDCLAFGTSASTSGNSDMFTADEADTFMGIYDDEMQLLTDEAELENVGDNHYTLRVSEPGTYYLLGIDPNAATTDACNAPASAMVIVTDKQEKAPIEIQTTDGDIPVAEVAFPHGGPVTDGRTVNEIAVTGQGTAVVSGKQVEIPCTVVLYDEKADTCTEISASGTDGKAYLFQTTLTADQKICISLKGDVNNDGKVNEKDAVRLLRFLNSGSEGNNEIDKISYAGADLNGDDQINEKDSVRLLRFLNGGFTVNHELNWSIR